eukprot:scaffold451_cov184-Amphora_coffeaeformis.AAC.12
MKCSFALLVAAMSLSSVVDAFASPRLVVRSSEVNTLYATTVEGSTSSTTRTYLLYGESSVYPKVSR